MGFGTVSRPFAILFYSVVEGATWVIVALTGMQPLGVSVGIAVSLLTTVLLAGALLAGGRRPS
ncbi:MAG: hypothetical protein IT304_00755 [Dehalococcoidia bacterium]|nr:hypothetical protein [Dehalococcoidia bacterium]